MTLKETIDKIKTFLQTFEDTLSFQALLDAQKLLHELIDTVQPSLAPINRTPSYEKHMHDLGSIHLN